MMVALCMRCYGLAYPKQMVVEICLAEGLADEHVAR